MSLKETDLNFCRICRAPRVPVASNGRVYNACNTCGSPLTTTPVKVAAKQPMPPCPGCAGTHVIEAEPERFHCRQCRAVFERVETRYSGNDPARNAGERESHEQREAERKRRSRGKGND